MKINLYFGETSNKVIYLDNQKPIDQVTEVKLLFDEKEDFNIKTYSPYIIEAVDAYSKKLKVKVHYFNRGKETDILNIFNEVSEAFYIIQDINDDE